MKKIIILSCILISFSISIFGQDNTDQIPQDTPVKKPGYRPHSIGISQRFGGGHVWAKGLGVNYNQAISLTSLDFYTEKRIGKSQYTPLVQLRFAAPMGKRSFTDNHTPFTDDIANQEVSTYGPFISAFSLGFLFGGSQYLFDKRSKELGTGWSMMINGGFIINIYGFSKIDYTGYKTPISLGGEVSFKPIYNFKKNVALTFGFDIGYEMSFNHPKSSNVFPDENFNPYSDMLQHALNYGFSIGVLF